MTRFKLDASIGTSCLPTNNPNGHNYPQKLLIKWAFLGFFLIYFRLLKQKLQFLKQIYVKFFYVHPVYGAGIGTNDLWKMSFLL